MLKITTLVVNSDTLFANTVHMDNLALSVSLIDYIERTNT